MSRKEKGPDAESAAPRPENEDSEHSHHTQNEASEQVTQADLFDLEGLRLSQDLSTLAAGKKLLTTVPVRKPTYQEFK